MEVAYLSRKTFAAGTEWGAALSSGNIDGDTSGNACFELVVGAPADSLPAKRTPNL